MDTTTNTLTKSGFAALAIGVALALSPMKADAATITGQIDISGTVSLNNSDFSAAGNADLNDPGIVLFALGDFDTFVNVGDLASLTDIDFTAPAQIWSVGGFTFTATAFSGFVDSAQKAFTAAGIISGNSFDDTEGTLTFTAQENDPAVTVSFSTTTVPVPLPAGGLLLLTALGGVAALRRKRKAA